MLGRNLGGICKGISTARFKMNNVSSDIHVVRIEYSGEWLELKKTEKKKWKLRSSPPSLPQLFSLFCAYRGLRGRGCRGPSMSSIGHLH